MRLAAAAAAAACQRSIARPRAPALQVSRGCSAAPLKLQKAPYTLGHLPRCRCCRMPRCRRLCRRAKRSQPCAAAPAPAAPAAATPAGLPQTLAVAESSKLSDRRRLVQRRRCAPAGGCCRRCCRGCLLCERLCRRRRRGRHFSSWRAAAAIWHCCLGNCYAEVWVQYCVKKLLLDRRLRHPWEGGAPRPYHACSSCSAAACLPGEALRCSAPPPMPAAPPPAPVQPPPAQRPASLSAAGACSRPTPAPPLLAPPAGGEAPAAAALQACLLSLARLLPGRSAQG